MLHQGALSYDNSDVYQEQNKVDKFTLYFNQSEFDGGSSTIYYCCSAEKTESRVFEVNALNLIKKLRLCAMGYFKNNKEKFSFMNITIIEKE